LRRAVDLRTVRFAAAFFTGAAFAAAFGVAVTLARAVVLRTVLRRGFAVVLARLRVLDEAFLAFGVAMNYLRCVGRSGERPVRIYIAF
jgi:hypothetical protein